MVPRALVEEKLKDAKVGAAPHHVPPGIAAVNGHLGRQHQERSF